MPFRFLLAGLSLTLAALLLAAPASAAPTGEASAPTADPKITKALDELDLKYEVGADGDAKLIFSMDDGRSQLVFIQSKMETYGGTSIREIWSPAFQVEGALAPELANRLLADSQSRKVGAWQVMELGDDKRLVVYSIKVPDPAEKQDLYNLINAAMVTADELEKEITEQDEF